MTLQPCPFCGGSNIKVFHWNDGEKIEYCQCMDCTSCGPDQFKGRHWNKRAALAAPLPIAAAQEHDRMPPALDSTSVGQTDDGAGSLADPGMRARNAEGSPSVAAAAPLPQPPEWIPVSERLPQWAVRDAEPCVLNGNAIAPALYSRRVLVTVVEAGQPCVSTDKLVALEGSAPWWDNYGQRVTHWMPFPKPPEAPEPNEQETQAAPQETKD